MAGSLRPRHPSRTICVQLAAGKSGADSHRIGSKRSPSRQVARQLVKASQGRQPSVASALDTYIFLEGATHDLRHEKPHQVKKYWGVGAGGDEGLLELR